MVFSEYVCVPYNYKSHTDSLPLRTYIYMYMYMYYSHKELDCICTCVYVRV